MTLVHRLRLFSCIFLYLMSSDTALFAQSSITFTGKVIDENLRPLEFASISYTQGNVQLSTDTEGLFRFTVRPNIPEVTIRISFVGKKAIQGSIAVKDIQPINTFVLEELSLNLEEVSVLPERKISESSNSSIIFDKEAIRQVQAFSLMDVLNTLPGKATEAPVINNPQTITLRNGPLTKGSNSNDQLYDINNSLGVAIIMDGVVQSNDANMQSRSLSRNGMLGSIIKSNGNFGSFDVPYQGLDLREIPVESIESIEVIQGVASAKYGDLTDGAIIIERQAGNTPYQFTTNVNAASVSSSLSKGFALGNKWGALNANFNYTNSNSDPRDKMNQYERVAQSLMWTKNFGSAVKNTLSFDFNKRLDDVKLDPDDGSQRMTYSKNSGVRLSNRLSATLNHSILQRLNLTASYSESNQETYSQWQLNQSPQPYTNKDTTGIYEGYWIPGNYLAKEEILGNPVSFSSNMDLSGQFSSGPLDHRISLGASYSYSNNGGKGIVMDADRPRFLSGDQNERPYSYEYTPSLQNFGVYIEDQISTTIAGKAFSTSVGLRHDFQNGKGYLQPRINSRLSLNKNWQLNAAYGISVKGPTMAHRYPAPEWIDIPLLQYYTGYADQSINLMFTDKHIPDNSHLKSSKATQLEIGARYQNRFLSASLFAFFKNSRNGFASVANFRDYILPEYEVRHTPGEKAEYYPTGNMVQYAGLTSYQVRNDVSSDNHGLELMLSTRKIQSIQTSFNFSSVLSYNFYKNKSIRVHTPDKDIEIDGHKIWYALYNPKESERYSLMSKFGSTTHIPKIGFIVSFNADVFWINSMYQDKDSQNPIAYINDRMEYFAIENFNPDDPVLGQLRLSPGKDVSQPIIYGIVNMSIIKEIRKNLRFSLSAYNAFDLHPEYYKEMPDGSIVEFKYNNPVSITGGISLKF